MALTKIELLSILKEMPDCTEICTPSLRRPQDAVTQIARVDRAINPAGEPMLILVPVTILPFRASVPE